MNLSTSILLLPAVLLTACQVKKPTVRTEEPMRIVSTAAQARIDRVLEQFVTDEDVVGVSALVYERGEEVYFGAFGLADREAGTPMDRNTIVQIFSMTKPITGVALMQLYEQGKFLMDDPLSMYAPEFGPVQVFTGVDEAGQPVLEAVNRPILIRDITRHTAGFATDASAPGLGPLLAEADPGNINHTLPEFAERLASVPLAFQPGTQWL
ncbi:MAG: beta-lactamase family protein, partial [Lewinella sp.]|nr:beta-lactamase family protein [Lewinella sp.]